MKFSWFLLATLLPWFYSCAATQVSQNHPATRPPLGESAPCEDCIHAEDAQYSVISKFIHVEGVQSLDLARIALPIGVVPALQINASVEGRCSFCEAFSEDAVAFDYHATLHAALAQLVGEMAVKEMLPGLDVPEKDSTWMRLWMDSLRSVKWMEGEDFASAKPWLQRAEGAFVQTRNSPPQLRALLSQICSRYGLQYLFIPMSIQLQMQPNLGEEGGYALQYLWSVWNAQGDLQYLSMEHLIFSTTNDVPPAKDWFAPVVGRSLPTLQEPQ